MVIRQKSNKRQEFFFLGLIILFSLVLRTYQLTKVPSGFFCDEAAIGYNAYKLLTTGRDEYGLSWPVFFRSFGDYRTPVPIYSNLVTVALFGLSEFAVRLAPALYGVGTTILLYFVGKKLSNKFVGFTAAMLFAINPWALQVNRWGAEYSPYLFFITLGLLLYILAFEKPKLLILSFLTFGITLYTYQPSWVAVPPFLLGALLLWLVKKKGSKKILLVIIGLCVFYIICRPIISGIKSELLLSRWHQSFDDKTNVTIYKKIFKIKDLYIDHFRSSFLFKTGENGIPGRFITRNIVRGMGEFYYYQLFLLIIGIIVAFHKRKGWLLILLLLLLYPLGSVLSFQGPNVTRSELGIIPITLLSALGFSEIYSLLINNRLSYTILMSTCLIFFVFSLNYYLYLYYVDYPKYSSDYWGWQYGPKDIINYFMSVEDKYDEMYYTGEANAPQIFLPFYTIDGKLGCKKCALGDIKQLDAHKKQLFVANPGIIKQWGKGFQVVREFVYPNGDIAFQAVIYHNK